MEYWPLVEKSSPDMIAITTAAATMVTAVGTLAIAAITAIMVWATNRMAKVSERTLKAGATPQVVAYLQAHLHDHIVPDVAVVLENIGQGTAQNVIYGINFEDEASRQIAKKYSITNDTGVKIDFMSQGARREIFLGATHELYDKEAALQIIAPFKVTVQYENLEGKQCGEESFVLDVLAFLGAGGQAKSSLVDIQASLRSLPKIEQHLEKLTKSLLTK